MKRSTLMIALGGKPPKEDADMSEDEAPADEDESIDDAIDLALDPDADAATRREAFRRAVKGC